MKIAKVTRLPQLIQKLRSETTDLQTRMEATESAEKGHAKAINKILDQLDALQNSIDSLDKKVAALGHRSAEIEHMLTLARHQKTTKNSVASGSAAPQQERFADNHLLDEFYIELENNFRGTEEEIKQKQAPHMKLFKATKVDYKKYPVIDLGSGRGEFLDLLKENNIRGIGVDLNESMVARMQEQGFEAVNDDAINYLLNSKTDSLGGVVGFHIAEHVPFDQLMMLISEAHRALVPGGFLMLETPNPENLTVGAFTFHYDPSHLKPIPPAIMEFMAKFKGFEKTEIVRSQPILSDKQINALTTDKQLRDLYKRVYGPRDYAVVAYK